MTGADSKAVLSHFVLLWGQSEAKWPSNPQYRQRWLSRWYLRWASVNGPRFLEVLSILERSIGPGAVSEAVLFVEGVGV